MKVKKDLKKCMVFNLKMLDAIRKGDFSNVKNAKEVGEIIKKENLKIIRRTIVDGLRNNSGTLSDSQIKMLEKIIVDLDIPEGFLVIDKARLKELKTDKERQDFIENILKKDYGEGVGSEEIYLLYSFLIQEAISLDNQQLIDKLLNRIEKIDEE